MPNQDQLNKIAQSQGFIAALDQSGGSTPKALANYGVDEGSYSGEAEMYEAVHAMRSRIITSPAFNGDKIIGAILFEKTMDAQVEDTPTAQYLWDTLSVVPFLKIDKGLADEENGCQVMKPMPELDALLNRAVDAGIFGTKMRSTINAANADGIAAVVEQQFSVATQVLDAGLIPIIEPEVNINNTDKAECEALLLEQLLKHVNALPEGRQIMLKLTLPEEANFYAELVGHANVLSVVALSGGYDLNEACTRLAANKGMIASFSRALTNGLSFAQSPDEFDAALQSAIDTIYAASVDDNAASCAA